MKPLACEGSCEEHQGPVRKVHVVGWCDFFYCDAAVAEDKRRGLTVKDPAEEDNA